MFLAQKIVISLYPKTREGKEEGEKGGMVEFELWGKKVFFTGL